MTTPCMTAGMNNGAMYGSGWDNSTTGWGLIAGAVAFIAIGWQLGEAVAAKRRYRENEMNFRYCPPLDRTFTREDVVNFAKYIRGNDHRKLQKQIGQLAHTHLLNTERDTAEERRALHLRASGDASLGVPANAVAAGSVGDDFDEVNPDEPPVNGSGGGNAAAAAAGGSGGGDDAASDVSTTARSVAKGTALLPEEYLKVALNGMFEQIMGIGTRNSALEEERARARAQFRSKAIQVVVGTTIFFLGISCGSIFSPRR